MMSKSERETVRRCLLTEEGRRALAVLNKHLKTQSSVFNAGNDRQNAYNQGRQSVGHELNQILREANNEPGNDD